MHVGTTLTLERPVSVHHVKDTVESRFLEPPGETQIGSRNREFEKSNMALNYAYLTGYCLIMSKC